MKNDFETVISTPAEVLELCPMCGGPVALVHTKWDWDPFNPMYAKFRCSECGGQFEYQWRTDPWKHVPNAIEWWNTRAQIRPPTCAGFDTEQLLAVAALLKDNDMRPEDLQQLCTNMEAAVKIAQGRVIRDLDRQLQAFLENNRLEEAP